MGVAGIVKAELYLQISWLRSNRILFALQLFWPYTAILVIYVMGSAYGSVENLASALGVEDPLLYIVAASAIMFAASGIIDQTASVALWHRWLGTLPYIYTSTPSFTRYLLVSGLTSSLFQSAFNFLALAPAAFIIGGLSSGLRLFLVFAVMIIGALPLIGLGITAAIASILAREEGNVLSFLNPLLVFLGGVFYPIEILPRILQEASTIIPVRYVVDAARLAAGFQTPTGQGILLILYSLALLILLYNGLASLGVSRLERATRKRGLY
ncbi:MAG: ABC transporter permease [Desulfurococcales archaeon]|nr:ABC transporter permease [Desulfurococcales archaeon]MCE4629541.1 ABC transporter permease [Desulfurococcales archaeon]